MRDSILQILDQQGTYSVIEALAAQPDSLAAAKTFFEVVGHLYWKQKDIHRTVVMAQAGIQFGLTAAVTASSYAPELTNEIRGIAKGLAFNLASFTWPGWDEPGIAISAAYLLFGFEAAALNLRLAHELNKGDLPISRAYWLVGAHALSAGAFQEAADQFTTAKTYSDKVEATAESLLCEGYRCLALALLSPQEIDNGPFLQIIAQLQETPNGADLAAQLQTAWNVFTQPHTKEYTAAQHAE
jgi:hypothetical protein